MRHRRTCGRIGAGEALKVLFHTDANDIGGNETAMVHIATALRQRGHEVALTGRTGAAQRFLEPHFSRWIAPPGFRNWDITLVDYKPDLCVVVQGDIFSLSRMARRRGIPAVWMYGHPLRREERDLGSTALSLFSAIVAQSHFLARTLNQVTGETAGPVHIIPNGIDCDSFRPASISDRGIARAKLGLGWDDFVVGFGARWVEYKRHRDLLQAFRLLRQSCPNAHLVLWGRADGRGSEEIWRSLSSEMETLGDSVHCLGAEPGQVPFWLSALDAFAFPAVGEGLGSALLEAMAMEIPVVVVRSGGLVEPFRYGNCGIRVPKEDYRSLAGALQRLATRPLARRGLGKIGREIIVRHYSRQQMANRYVNLIERLVNQ